MKECEHLNSTTEMIEYDVPELDTDSMRFANTGSEIIPTEVCPDCGYEEEIIRTDDDGEDDRQDV